MKGRFCGNVVECESSDPQGVVLQISQIHELASRVGTRNRCRWEAHEGEEHLNRRADCRR